MIQNSMQVTTYYGPSTASLTSVVPLWLILLYMVESGFQDP